MQKFLLLIMALLTMFLMVISGGCVKKAETPTTPEQKQQPMGENLKKPNKKLVFVASTEYPEGCPSCHQGKGLNDLTKKIKNHPQVQANTIAECAGCHKKAGRPVLQNIIHRRHYRVLDSAFVKGKQGSCIHCHKKTAEGEFFIPGLEPAGKKFVAIQAARTDLSPNGCNDCHQKDYSLTNTVKKIEGHPAVSSDDFNNCYNCHGKAAPNLGLVLHNKHLTSTTYQTKYGNACLNCHRATGEDEIIVKGKS